MGRCCRWVVGVGSGVAGRGVIEATRPRPSHIDDAVASLELTDDEVSALEAPYVLTHSSTVKRSACRGNTFSVSTRCTSGSLSRQPSARTVRPKSRSAAWRRVDSTTPLVAIPVSTRCPTSPARSTTSRSLPVNALTRFFVTTMSPGSGATSGWIWALTSPSTNTPVCDVATKLLLRRLMSGYPGRNPITT
jgi:hypothetical protein